MSETEFAPTDAEAIDAGGFRALHNGSTTDDDGPAVDQYFEEAPSGPVDYGSILSDSIDALPETTRMFIRSYALVSPDGVRPPDPIQALPADPNRKELWIEASAQYLVIGSDKGDMATLAQFRNADTQAFYSACHTGPVWIYYNDPSPVAAAVLNVTVRAVTK